MSSKPYWTRISAHIDIESEAEHGTWQDNRTSPNMEEVTAPGESQPELRSRDIIRDAPWVSSIFQDSLNTIEE